MTSHVVAVMMSDPVNFNAMKSGMAESGFLTKRGNISRKSVVLYRDEVLLLLTRSRTELRSGQVAPAQDQIIQGVVDYANRVLAAIDEVKNNE